MGLLPPCGQTKRVEHPNRPGRDELPNSSSEQNWRIQIATIPHTPKAEATKTGALARAPTRARASRSDLFLYQVLLRVIQASAKFCCNRRAQARHRLAVATSGARQLLLEFLQLVGHLAPRSTNLWATRAQDRDTPANTGQLSVTDAARVPSRGHKTTARLTCDCVSLEKNPARSQEVDPIERVRLDFHPMAGTYLNALAVRFVPTHAPAIEVIYR